MTSNDDRFDAAIDRAVRDIVDVEAPADLRARVIERVARPAAPQMPWALRVLAPVVAAAIVIVSLVLWLPSRSAPPIQTAQRQHAPATIPSTPMPPAFSAADAPRVNAARAEPTQSPRVSRVRLVRATADGTTEDSNVVPLDPITPIHVAALAQSDITPRPVVIAPLAPIAQVQIAPLTPPDGRH